jgi:DNA-binding GntR family transcriptional regulator
MSELGPASITESVYARLRADLLACRLVPGQKLKIDALCKQLSAGSSAVREALSRLASEGFVAAEPQRGFRVAPLSLSELHDLTNTRCQIEELCLRDSLAHGDLEWETQLIAAQHRLSRLDVAAPGDPQRYSDTYAEAHTLFHTALVAACRSTWLLRLRALLYTQQARYRWLSRPLARVERDLDAEHAAIAQAALTRDADQAVALLTQHLHLTARIILDAAVAEPGQAKGGQGGFAPLDPPPRAAALGTRSF